MECTYVFTYERVTLVFTPVHSTPYVTGNFGTKMFRPTDKLTNYVVAATRTMIAWVQRIIGSLFYNFPNFCQIKSTFIRLCNQIIESWPADFLFNFVIRRYTSYLQPLFVTKTRAKLEKIVIKDDRNYVKLLYLHR